MEQASRQVEELDELKKQLDLASKQEKEAQKLKAQLDQVTQREKELREEKEQQDQVREGEAGQARGVIPQLTAVETIARKARKDVSRISVSSNDSGDVLALAVMAAAENVEQLSQALASIEEKLHAIISGLSENEKQSKRDQK